MKRAEINNDRDVQNYYSMCRELDSEAHMYLKINVVNRLPLCCCRAAWGVPGYRGSSLWRLWMTCSCSTDHVIDHHFWHAALLQPGQKPACWSKVSKLNLWYCITEAGCGSGWKARGSKQAQLCILTSSQGGFLPPIIGGNFCRLDPFGSLCWQ